uniref:Uncharacterized protein n=1 Tax=Timema poppense TaxID=170557 RepID=A0A7R9D6K8_TIMPO|nr:unnamed protein product [Timema poppensis]
MHPSHAPESKGSRKLPLTRRRCGKETNDFDPEKFRQVNRKVKEDYNKQAVTQDDISYLPDLRKGTMPSLVSPTPMLDYNISEENILNSIEEEYALNKNSFLNLSQK